MFRDTPSQYKRHWKKNEGYSVVSFSFAIMSVWLGVLGNGVQEIAWCAFFCGVLGLGIGILGIRHKRQVNKDLMWVTVVIAPIGAFIALDALCCRMMAAAWHSF